MKALCGKLFGTVNWYVFKLCASKLDRVTGGFCGILLNRLITAGSGGTAPLTTAISGFMSALKLNYKQKLFNARDPLHITFYITQYILVLFEKLFSCYMARIAQIRVLY